LGVRQSASALTVSRTAKECDDSNERDAKAHSGCDHLHDIHGMDSFESRLANHVEESNDPDDKQTWHEAATLAHEDLLKIAACYL
jgi:hypothetical protein